MTKTHKKLKKVLDLVLKIESLNKIDIFYLLHSHVKSLSVWALSGKYDKELQEQNKLLDEVLYYDEKMYDEKKFNDLITRLETIYKLHQNEKPSNL
jgi:hypothetical protein